MIASLSLIATLAAGQTPIPIALFEGQVTWRSYTLKGLHLSMLLPTKPLERKMRLTESVDTVSTTSWYTLQVGGFNVTLNYSTYRPGVPVSAKSASEGALAGLRQTKPNAKFSTAMKKIVVSGVSGYKVFATFNDVDAKVAYEAYVLQRGQKLWQIITTYESTPNYAAMAKKALSSVQLRP